MQNMKSLFLILAFFIVNSSNGMDKDAYEAICLREEFNMLPCNSGGCFHFSQYCDGTVDCDDGTDETMCPLHIPDPEVCNATHQYMCGDGHGCIPNTWICDNKTDCSDGSDEVNCTLLPEIDNNSTCKGFLCGDGKCISNLWVCDGLYDCEDKSDEYRQDMCRTVTIPHEILDGASCQELPPIGERFYKCKDSSLCLPSSRMCDGMKDCRDASDEGNFCDNWDTMCNHLNCTSKNTKCTPERHGPSCICEPASRQFNYTSRQCEDVDECLTDRPQCSHYCENAIGHYQCTCDPGYNVDEFKYLCYAPEPEGMLFFSTQNDIRYLKIKSKQMVTVATGIKQAHGVSYDGTYIYWVETADGHESINKAELANVKETKQVLAGIGLEEPGDIAIDYLGGNIYFTDSERGIISACKPDGSICTTIKTQTVHPKYIALDAKNGLMYWADWQGHSVIMSARMDGSKPEVLVDSLQAFATGLMIDSPNGRLYYVDKTIKVLVISTKQVYTLFNEPFHHPYSISVFENTVYWSDWTSNTIQTTDKIHSTAQKRNILLKLSTAIIGMHMYHPVLMNATSNPCSKNVCSHLCFVTSNATHVCACPDGMELRNNKCTRIGDYRTKYLIVGGGQLFTRIQYDELGNPENHATHFDIGRVQVMAYDIFRDNLIVYDLQMKMIRYINMNEFSLGVTHLLTYEDLENVVDMDYDYATDNLYILDAGRRVVEVFALKTHKRANVYHFSELETPIALCVVPDYGRMLVALVEGGEQNRIHIDSIGLNGEERKHIIMNNLKGPHIRLRYVQHMDVVFISDESNGAIDYVHPDGTGRENYRELLTTITSLAVADMYVFWTDRRTSRLFWSDVHEITYKIRRIDLALFPNNTQLLVQATSSPIDPNDPLLKHPCQKSVCPHVCVQEPHVTPNSPSFSLGYKCLCPPGLMLKDDKCVKVIACGDHEIPCHKSNACVMKVQKCDGRRDCPQGEDEENCNENNYNLCTPDEIYCNGFCLNKKVTPTCGNEIQSPGIPDNDCSITQYECANTSVCISRSQLCDGNTDCPDGDDEMSAECDTFACYETEFMCSSGSCILKSWTCDGDRDCNDGSDEANCVNITCGPGYYQCKDKECIQLSKRCDGHQDCTDSSDEDDCDEKVLVEVVEAEPHCAAWEYVCEKNTSICLPHTARCNMKVECPGGTDEDGCDLRCSRHGWFACSQQLNCIAMNRVCNNHKDCDDGSDETPDACAQVNRSSHLYPMRSIGDCSEGFTCRDGQCIEWRQVCDNRTDCVDESDEYGQCSTSCKNNQCSYHCRPTPQGARCTCLHGYKLASDQHTCEDIDECQNGVCSQGCFNIPGSFACSCHRGYALRTDHRSCKAVKGNMSILYVSGNTVQSLSADGYTFVEYSDESIMAITDMDLNIRQGTTYVTSADKGKLIEINSTNNAVIVTNIGKPTKVAVDWVTGNVYFVDNTASDIRIRVCHVTKKRCAVLQKLPSDAKVTSLIVDPSSRLMFYCVTRQLESVLWSASFTGSSVTDLTTLRNCTGLAVDSFKQKLYVAESEPAHIIQMDYEGDNHKKILADELRTQAPSRMVIFEDYVYYIASKSFRLGRCLLFGHQHCEKYVSRAFDANTFVIRHESVQRDDLVNECEGVICSNVCAVDRNGAKCICDDGSIAEKGQCPDLDSKLLPLFNGLTSQQLASTHSASFTVIMIILFLAMIYLCVFLYYHFIHKPKKMREAATYTEVRFQNESGECSPISGFPTIQMTSEAATIEPHEYENPLQYVKNMWYNSIRKQTRPMYTSRAPMSTINSPLQHDLSDTESDLDNRENKRFFHM